MEEFIVNEYITLKLEEGKTNIYIKGDEQPFIQCKYLLMRKTIYELEDFLENIESVDELAEHLDHSMEYEPELVDIPAETRFWAHKSNMQVWAENDYDTRFLHSNLAFPLLKELSEPEIGDPLAKKVFRKEIIKRFSSGNGHLQGFLKDEGYMDDFTEDEIIQLSLCNEHYEILREISDEVGSDIYPLFEYRNKEIVRLALSVIEYLPESLLKLKDTLRVLDITVDLKELPDWIEEFTNLKKLSILQTQIDILPENIGKLSALKKLSIRHNPLRELPEWIGDLQSLEELDLRNNELSILPVSFNKLSRLRKLSLDYNKFENVPEPIRGLKNLESLGLIDNPLKKIQEWVFKLPSIDRIWVSKALKEKVTSHPKLKYIAPLL